MEGSLTRPERPSVLANDACWMQLIEVAVFCRVQSMVVNDLVNLKCEFALSDSSDGVDEASKTLHNCQHLVFGEDHLHRSN